MRAPRPQRGTGFQPLRATFPLERSALEKKTSPNFPFSLTPRISIHARWHIPIPPRLPLKRRQRRRLRCLSRRHPCHHLNQLIPNPSPRLYLQVAVAAQPRLVPAAVFAERSLRRHVAKAVVG